jgi:hypothetical protein
VTREGASRVLIAAVLLSVTAASLAALGCQAARRSTRAGFWFDDVTFALPAGLAERLGGQITTSDVDTITRVAVSELKAAYAEYRVEFTDDRRAIYTVRVVDEAGRHGGAAHSMTLGAFGGTGIVSDPVIVGYAFMYAPPEATRAMIVEGIGRGLARAAAHEFAHQFVPRVNIHASRDPESYEYATADRFAQCYGPMRWDLAKDALAKALGVRAEPARVDLRHGGSS